jgi:LysR family transcriptional regulator, hca operon transcriptional activator
VNLPARYLDGHGGDGKYLVWQAPYLIGMTGVELRHLRYFVAVAEERGFTQAAEKRLHVAQPSLSRQIRDLESDLGVQLMIRGPRGMELTSAGQVFLDHARSILWQVEAAGEAARRAARPAKASFIVGFLTGYEIDWLPEVLDILRDELHKTEIVIHSASSPELTQGLLRGRIDVAFVRPDRQAQGLAFKLLTKEPLFVLLPDRHPLASCGAVRLDDIASETFIGFSKTYAPALRLVINDFARRSGVRLVPGHEAETLPTVTSLVLSTPGVSLLPAYARRLLPPSVVGVPLKDEAPTIDLVIAYAKETNSYPLKLILSRADQLIERRSRMAGDSRPAR